MADITLSDYAGYILTEMIKAREMADAYTRRVAERYAADPVMRHFSAPRFRTPKVGLTIPVLVSAARFTEAVRFDFPEAEFVAFIVARAADVRARVELARSGGLHRGAPDSPDATRSPAVERIAARFHERLAANPDPQHPDTIVTLMWTQVLRACLGEAGLAEFYDGYDPRQDLLTRTTAEVLDMVRRRTVVDRTVIESLLVDPETHAVAGGATEASVFTINVELVEDGVFFRSVRDESTGAASTIVDFE